MSILLADFLILYSAGKTKLSKNRKKNIEVLWYPVAISRKQGAV